MIGIALLDVAATVKFESPKVFVTSLKEITTEYPVHVVPHEGWNAALPANVALPEVVQAAGSEPTS